MGVPPPLPKIGGHQTKMAARAELGPLPVAPTPHERQLLRLAGAGDVGAQNACLNCSSQRAKAGDARGDTQVAGEEYACLL